MTLTGDERFKGKLTHGLKNDVRYLINFHASSGEAGNLILLSKVSKDFFEKYRRVMSHDTEEWCKIWR